MNEELTKVSQHPGFRDLGIVMLVATLAGAALSLSFPLLSLVLREAGVSSAAIGWSAAGHGIGMLLAAPFYARLIALFGARAVMTSGLAVTALILALLPLQIDPVLWFFGRMIMGAAGAAVFVVTESAVNAMVDDKRRGLILGIYSTFFCVGYASGPAIIAIAGTSGFAPFLLGAGLLASGIWPANQAHGAQNALAGGDPKTSLRPILEIAKQSPLPIFGIAVFGLVEMGLLSLLPIYLTDRGITTENAALLIAIWVAGNVLLQLPIGWLSDIWPRRLIMLGSTCLSLLLLLPLYSLAAHQIWLWPLMLLMGGMMGSLYTLNLALLGSLYRGSVLTIANTTFIMALEVGVMIGPAAAGQAMANFGDHHLMSVWIIALSALIVVTIASLMKRPATADVT